MAYELREGGGSLFKNDKKTQENHPDYKGDCMIGGVQYWISAWLKGKEGSRFFSFSFQPKQKAAPQQQQYKSEPTGEDLPF